MTSSVRLIAAAVLALAAFVAPVSAQITLSVVNAGFEDPVSSGFPTAAGNWKGDQHDSVTAENGVTPYAGSRMLKFVHNGLPTGTNGTGADAFQIVDLSPYAASVAAGNFTLTLSAYVNRSDSNFNEFWTRMLSFSQPMANFETELMSTGNMGTASNYTSTLADADPATWQHSSVSFTVPTNTTYVLVEVTLNHPGSNSPSVPGGYYVDNVTLTAIPEPSTYALLVGLAGLGAVCWRRRSEG